MADNDDPKLTLKSGHEEDYPAPPPSGPDLPSEQKLAETPDQARQKAIIDELEKNYQQSHAMGQKMLTGIQDRLAELMKLRDQPLPDPPQLQKPPPLTQQQQGGLSEFVFNLLKFGALTAMAFGTAGRGYGHNAIWKGAIGAALTGYANGRKDVMNKSMQLWEKNREMINDANKQQIERYKEILDNRKLTLSDKMDTINNLSRLLGDYRMFQDSENKNLNDVQRSLQDKEKLQNEQEATVRKQRDKLYNVLGKPAFSDEYWAWVNKKSGRNLTPNSSAEDIEKAETDYPVSDFLIWHENEEIEKAGKKTREQEEAKKEVKEGTPTEEEQQKRDAAQKKVDELTAKILPGL